MEIRPYPKNPDYGVTCDGRVFRIVKARYGRDVPFELVQVERPSGYHTISLTDERGARAVKVHRMVALAFLPPPPASKMDVAHKNGKRGDNRVENLYWATRKENMADCVAHGTRLRGEAVAGAKLTEDQVREIRARAAAGVRQVHLCDEFDMSPAAICQIVKRERWAHV